MKKESAGLLMYRRRGNRFEVFLVHPGGPFFMKKDDGVWSIPKGEADGDEDKLQTAVREFAEETGMTPPDGPFESLGSIRQKSGKIVHAWGVEGDWDDQRILKSNSFEMEWPPRSGRKQSFPEVDKCSFFPIDEAKRKINSAQAELIARLEQRLNRNA